MIVEKKFSTGVILNIKVTWQKICRKQEHRSISENITSEMLAKLQKDSNSGNLDYNMAFGIPLRYDSWTNTFESFNGVLRLDLPIGLKRVVCRWYWLLLETQSTTGKQHWICITNSCQFHWKIETYRFVIMWAYSLKVQWPVANGRKDKGASTCYYWRHT